MKKIQEHVEKIEPTKESQGNRAYLSRQHAAVLR